MVDQKISVEDWVDISNLFGKYQWLVDAGDEEGWSGLFTEDGVFEGLGPGFRGREALKQIPRMGLVFGGMARHMPGSMWMEYGGSPDEVFLHCYSQFSVWSSEEPTQFLQLALCKVHLVRIDGDWKLKSNTIKGLRDAPAAINLATSASGASSRESS